jgi:phage tail sheath protein FI
VPEYLAPGVYIEEISIGAVPIEGVSTSTAAFLGETERGPVNPTLVTGLEEYRRTFGHYRWKYAPGDERNESRSFMRHAAEGFFTNGGKRCFISRIIAAGSIWATLPVLAAATEAPQSTPTPPAEGGETQPPTARRTRRGEEPALFTLRAIGPGEWGNHIYVYITEAGLGKTKPELFQLIVYYQSDDESEPSVVENYNNLSMNPIDQNFYEQRINGYSNLITVERNPSGAATRPEDRGHLRLARDRTDIRLGGGSDGRPVQLTDFTGEGDPPPAPGERRGLAALTEIDEISIVCVPNENDFEGLTDRLVAYCELLKSRFAILQAPMSPPQGLGEFTPSGGDSKYAAFYYPWLKVIDGQTDTEVLVPPGGHIAGIYARSDIDRGVHKAPANEVVRGIVGLQFTLTTGDQELLNPRGINCIRPLPGRGIRVWGARTISSDPSWRYVNVRRLFIYLEESIRHGTQWVVFEPNNEQLWDRVRQTCTDFLTTVWRDGALMGRTREEAFFVKCDRTTMTEQEIETGRIIIVIGVAPVRPAEFVIFRISQWQGGSVVEG